MCFALLAKTTFLGYYNGYYGITGVIPCLGSHKTTTTHQDNIGREKARRDTTRQDKAPEVKARQVQTRESKAVQGKKDKAWEGTAREVRASFGRGRQDTTIQG